MSGLEVGTAGQLNKLLLTNWGWGLDREEEWL